MRPVQPSANSPSVSTAGRAADSPSKAGGPATSSSRALYLRTESMFQVCQWDLLSTAVALWMVWRERLICRERRSSIVGVSCGRSFLERTFIFLCRGPFVKLTRLPIRAPLSRRWFSVQEAWHSHWTWNLKSMMLVSLDHSKTSLLVMQSPQRFSRILPGRRRWNRFKTSCVGRPGPRILSRVRVW